MNAENSDFILQKRREIVKIAYFLAHGDYTLLNDYTYLKYVYWMLPKQHAIQLQTKEMYFGLLGGMVHTTVKKPFTTMLNDYFNNLSCKTEKNIKFFKPIEPENSIYYTVFC